MWVCVFGACACVCIREYGCACAGVPASVGMGMCEYISVGVPVLEYLWVSEL